MSTIKIGQKHIIEHSFKLSDVKKFSKLSMDTNPIHLDEQFANKSIFKGRIVPGMLISSLFSGIIANHLPGSGSIYLQQNLQFKAPIYLDEKFRVEVIVKEIRDDKPIYTLETNCIKQDEQNAITGTAIILKK